MKTWVSGSSIQITLTYWSGKPNLGFMGLSPASWDSDFLFIILKYEWITLLAVVKNAFVGCALYFRDRMLLEGSVNGTRSHQNFSAVPCLWHDIEQYILLISSSILPIKRKYLFLFLNFSSSVFPWPCIQGSLRVSLSVHKTESIIGMSHLVHLLIIQAAFKNTWHPS